MANSDLMGNKFGGGYSLDSELNKPTTPSGVITNLYRSMPIGTTDIYSKIGYIIKVLYDILNRDKKDITDYDLKKEYINTQGLPKTEIEATAYLAKRFKLQSKEDYRNLWLLLKELNNLLNGDDIVRLFTARRIIEGKITYGDENLNSALSHMTEIVQDATLSSFDARRQALSTEIESLVKKEAATRGQIATLTQEVERKKAEAALIEPHYKELQKAATTVSWEPKSYTIDEDVISSSDIARIIRKQAEILVEYTGVSLEEAIVELGKHNTTLFELIDRNLRDLPRIGISNTYGSVAEFLLSDDYQIIQDYKVGNGGNLLHRKRNSRGEELEHGSVLPYIGLKLNVPENTEGIFRAIQKQKKQLEENVNIALQGEALKAKNQNLAGEVAAKERQLAELENKIAASRGIWQKLEAIYAKLQTRVVWNLGNDTHYLYYNNDPKLIELYYNNLIKEYSYRMHVSEKEAKIIIDSNCPGLSSPRTWNRYDVFQSKFPEYYEPKLSLEELLEQIRRTSSQPDISQLSREEKIALIAELSRQLQGELTAGPTTGGKAM